MNNVKSKVLVAGANGTTGRIIIDVLKQSGTYEPVAMIRKEEQKERFENENIETVLADLTGNLSQAVTGVKKVIFAAGSGGKKVVEVDQEGAKHLTDAAKEAGVEKFIMLSSMGADNPAQGGELEDYLEAKHKADEYLRASNLNYVIVRPGSLTNEDGTGKIKLGEKLDGDGNISRTDVAKTLVAALDEGVRTNQTFEILKGDVPIREVV
ncbi:SDR family oxidoreductase [Neolewinella agarilytica]|uniref:Uncharacterized conserved protein YbjT, contains NAD(P)-binding and DUF2867 domains n=1 Tax=Neolewinella agarilytica TaxID=478744 RepID=A0A1H8Z4T3_9BACT|nr:SDR family oxidoreductase [Neolewinella agarilytica]SEP59475.1 Uncharacterized conserved protein YbjT, contains NAD(P)-binding and DUF2867 domains [Neolewinella agarilytica]